MLNNIMHHFSTSVRSSKSILNSMYIPKEFRYKQDFPRIGYFIVMAELALKN